MTIVKCDKDDCPYNENGECASGIIWITETGECDIDEDEVSK